MLKNNFLKNFTIDCTGDVCVGDTIHYTETVWGGSHKKPINMGERHIIAKVIKDSYGKKKQQHTFTLLVVDSYGYSPLFKNIKVIRKGRNIYRNGTLRKEWSNEEERLEVLNEKHQRGSIARVDRQIRRIRKENYYFENYF
jgi:hypothetical protein